MSDYVLFQMWEPFRQSIISGHLFYVEQAQKRLLSQFGDMESEADKAAEKWLEQRGKRFDPERDDPSSIYEEANDVGIEFYQLLNDMRGQTRLSVVAGIYHEWDKKLREWLVSEIRHWNHGAIVAQKIWSVDFGKIAELLESFGWKIRDKDYFIELDACRLVVNVYKHGEGKSLEDLKKNYPKYLESPFGDSEAPFLKSEYLDYTHLKISDDDFKRFTDAIVSFWKDVPENIYKSQVIEVPDWFGKAIEESKERQNANEK